MPRDTLEICIIGGGFTGAAAAIACFKRLDRPFRLSVIEAGTSLGRGVAYGGHHPLHLLNVRARDLSIYPDRPGDFSTWAFRQIDQGENDANLLEGLGHAFLPRQLFGEYVRQRLFEAANVRNDAAFAIVNGTAVACRPGGGMYQVDLANGACLRADVVILATAYGVTRSPVTGALAPYDALSREQLSSAKSLALIGSGLTMVDVLLAARRDGFAGTATVFSRRGLWPQAHAPKGVVPQTVGLPQSKRLSRLAAAVRIACEAAEAHGTPWQAIINGLRPSLQDRWQALPIAEQARFLRHARRYWDVYRHRLPPEVHTRIQQEFDTGRAVLVRGRVIEVTRGAEGYVLTWLRRGADHSGAMEVDLAVDCSGFKPDLGSALIRSLVACGLARADAHGLGLQVDNNGAVKSADGAPSPTLFALGPLGQGSLWEITAVPEIVRQADEAAATIEAARGERSQSLLTHAS